MKILLLIFRVVLLSLYPMKLELLNITDNVYPYYAIFGDKNLLFTNGGNYYLSFTDNSYSIESAYSEFNESFFVNQFTSNYFTFTINDTTVEYVFPNLGNKKYFVT